jgi:mRNA interferase RelE/StbE
MADVSFTAAAIDDLRRIGPDAVPKVLKQVLLLTEDAEAGHPLGGDLMGFRKLVVGRNTWRVVYRITDNKVVEICEIWTIGARADAEVYAEAASRIKAAGGRRPELVELAQVIERLGRAAGEVRVDGPQPKEPVPDWLADRLIFTVGLPRAQVAALDLEAAVDVWTDFMAKPAE